MKKISSIFCGMFLLASTACQHHSGDWKSYSGDRNIERRVDSVLSLMTLEEKIGQMNQVSANWDITGPVMSHDYEPYLKKGLVGSLFNVYTVEGVRKMQDMALSESRLKIPVLFGFDVIHGYRTIFPMSLGEACSWDLELMERTAHIAAVEAAASGINWTFAPMMDIARDARWGRVMEGAGEDTYLGSLIAKARINGFQGGEGGKNLGQINAVLACAKHFVAYGAAEAGRDYNTVIMGDRTLYEVYLPPFKAAKDAGVATYMAAFNEISGVPCTGSKELMTDILRDKWDFRGFVVTDYTGINELVPHGFAKDEKMAGEKAANAGIDMDMTGAVFIKHLKQSVEEGKVSEKTIDNAVRHILEMKFILGLFDDPYKYLDSQREKDSIMTPEFLQVAREAVQRSVVLLKNDNNLFPIDPAKRQTVALIGPMIKEQESLNGEWAGKGVRSESVTLYEGLVERYKNTPVNFIYAQGCDLTTDDQSKFAEAISAAQRADIILVAMGEDFNYSGEAASRSNIKLPGVQQDLLKALKKTGKPIGLVLMNGRPLDLSWEDENINAIMEAWYPGTMAGHGLADVISGDYNPSGKLTMSFPRNVGQVPIYYNHKPTGRPVDPQNPYIDYKSSYLDVPVTPLYPFGHGLSYTTFKIDGLKLDKSNLKKGGTLTITANVTNTGNVDGEEVVQLYVRDIWASVTRPVKELKGFEKIALKKGESKQVSFTLSPEDLAFYNLDMKFEPEEGDFRLWVATSSADETNEASFTYSN
ncbi:MAG: beta-glucosidase BglX [Bacteroidales bacterium]|nr:beta-glucosidase BglX [Bacteroidales bacterium]